jgi:biotin carboxyl carrier protein/GNAT superfamily N-acetyltransferase
VIRRSVAGYEIDDDPARIDPAAAVAFLTTGAYWGRWRGEQDIRRQIAEAWRVVGAYDAAGAMVGFARAFSDGGSAYLADVYVRQEHRGVGLGKALVAMMVEEAAPQRWMLHTSDAHGLYRSFGFAAPDGRYLERPARGVRGDGSPRERGVPGGRPPGSAPSRSRRQVHSGSGDTLVSPMQGTISTIAVAEGERVSAGDVIVVLEAMKMEQPLTAHKDGTVTGLAVAVGQTVRAGAAICELKD